LAPYGAEPATPRAPEDIDAEKGKRWRDCRQGCKDWQSASICDGWSSGSNCIPWGAGEGIGARPPQKWRHHWQPGGKYLLGAAPDIAQMRCSRMRRIRQRQVARGGRLLQPALPATACSRRSYRRQGVPWNAP